MRSSGLAAFLAFFAIVCAIFSAVVTAADFAGHPERLETNLQIVAAAAIAAVVLLLLVRHLRAHEASAPDVPVDPNAPSLGWGAFAGLLGLVIIGVATFQLATRTQAPKPGDFLIFPAGSMFLFAGVLVALPREWVRARAVMSALLMTAFAVTFDGVAFGPGERHFSGGFSVGLVGSGFSPSELIGRIAFGIPAVISTVVAVVAWARVR